MRQSKRIISALVLAFVLLSLVSLPIAAEASGTGEISAVAIKLSMPAVNAADVSAVTASTTTGGCYISSLGWYDVYGQLMTNKFTNENATVQIVMTAAPGYSFASGLSVTIDGAAANYENNGSSIVVSKTYSPLIWKPNIIKHPGNETVRVGGTASFVAYASCADKSRWGIVDKDGSYFDADRISERFPGVIVESNYEKMNIIGVTAEMDGCKVLCNFSGPGGEAGTNYALIKVENAEAAAPAATASPAPTPVPTPTHEHSFSAELSCDFGFHWYECQCGEMNFRAEHIFEWTQKQAATAESSGSVQGKCSVCGYKLDAVTQLDPALIAAEEAAEEEIILEAATEAVEKEKTGFIRRILSLIVPGM